MLVPASAFAGGGSDRNDDRPRVGIALLPIGNDFHEAIREHVLAATARHPQINWDIRWATSAAQQIDMLQVMMGERYDAMIIMAADGALATPIAEAIYDTGTRTVIVNRPLLPNSRFTALVTGDSVAGGVNAARLLGERLGPGNHSLGVLRFGVGNPTDEERWVGFHQTLTTEFPNITIVGQAEGGNNRTTGLNGMNTLLLAHPHMDAVYTMDDEAALGALAAIEAAGRTDIRYITGFGGARDAYRLLEANDSRFIGSMSFFPTMIVEGVEMVVRILQGGVFPRETVLPSFVVHSGNVHQFLHMAVGN
jgi:ribose transport system substrate-binding protein